MTRKDFVLIASVLREALPENPNPSPAFDAYLIDRFADALRTTNSNFDRGRFIRAATPTERTTP